MSDKSELAALIVSASEFAKAGQVLWRTVSEDVTASDDDRHLCATISREFANLHCLMINGFGDLVDQDVVDLSVFFGAGNGSAASGGRPESELINGLEQMNPPLAQVVSITPAAAETLRILGYVDPTNPPSDADMKMYADILLAGVKVA